MTNRPQSIRRPSAEIRFLLAGWLAALSACGPSSSPGEDAGVDAGWPDAGFDAGKMNPDAGTMDAGVVPAVKSASSLFWVDPVLLDDAQVISFAKVMATIASDGHGGKLLDQWFHRFASTAHSERALPAQFVDALAA